MATTLADVSPTPFIAGKTETQRRRSLAQSGQPIDGTAGTCSAPVTGRKWFNGHFPCLPTRPQAPTRGPGTKGHPRNFSNEAGMSLTAHTQVSKGHQILFSKSNKTLPPSPHFTGLARKLVSAHLGSPKGPGGGFPGAQRMGRGCPVVFPSSWFPCIFTCEPLTVRHPSLSPWVTRARLTRSHMDVSRAS